MNFTTHPVCDRASIFKIDELTTATKDLMHDRLAKLVLRHILPHLVLLLRAENAFGDCAVAAAAPRCVGDDCQLALIPSQRFRGKIPGLRRLRQRNSIWHRPYWDLGGHARSLKKSP
jgi:hypothetical protein